MMRDDSDIVLRILDKNILAGVLNHADGVSIAVTRKDGCWILMSFGDPVVDEICKHEDWREFMALCLEFSEHEGFRVWEVPGYDEEPSEELIEFLHDLPVEWDGDPGGLNIAGTLILPGQRFIFDDVDKKVVVL